MNGFVGFSSPDFNRSYLHQYLESIEQMVVYFHRIMSLESIPFVQNVLWGPEHLQSTYQHFFCCFEHFSLKMRLYFVNLLKYCSIAIVFLFPISASTTAGSSDDTHQRRSGPFPPCYPRSAPQGRTFWRYLTSHVFFLLVIPRSVNKWGRPGTPLISANVEIFGQKK